jgi:hypothetical protein
MKYNSECVFEVIGNYPVVDQFDVLYPSLMSGSIQDNYVTGSMFTINKALGSPTTTVVQGNRGLAFSKLGVDRKNRPGLPITDFSKASYTFQPWYERAGSVKISRSFSDCERYFDSLPPQIDQIVSALNGNFYLNTANNTIQIRIGRNTSDSLFVQEFCESFPYEPRFTNIQRAKKILQEFKTKLRLSPLPRDIPIKTKSQVLIYVRIDANRNKIWFTHQPEEYSKIFFGFGDNQYIPYYLPNDIINGSEMSLNQPTWRFEDSTYLYGPIIRGWKYGLSSGNPKYTSAVFRRNRFGQFRDMLEQRETPVSIVDYEYSPFRYLGSVETPAIPPYTLDNFKPVNDVNEYTVKVRFVGKTYDSTEKKIEFFEKKPELTYSSNLSPFVTSSLPFFDGISRNRLEPQESLIGNNVKLGLGADAFKNLTIG